MDGGTQVLMDSKNNSNLSAMNFLKLQILKNKLYQRKENLEEEKKASQ